MHRDARWYRDPLAFRPERWLNGETDANPRYAYFPFSGGQRMCVGSHFATMQSGLVLATLAQRVDLEAVSSEPLRLVPSISLRPRDGVPVRLVAR